MLVIKTKLKEIPGKGIGLVADQEVKKGMVVWEFDLIVDIKIYKKDIPHQAENFFKTYAVDNGDDFVYLNVDNARFINHSDEPNIKSLGKMKDNIAIRDIEPGEEITIDYREIDVNGADF